MNIPQKIIPFLWHFVKRQWFAFFIVFITAIIWSINDVLFPYFIKLIVNAIHDFNGNRANIYSVLFWPLVALVSCWMVMEISARTQGFVLISTYPRFRAAIRQTVYDYVKQHTNIFPIILQEVLPKKLLLYLQAVRPSWKFCLLIFPRLLLD
jgi:ATP-binding cassette subfamily B protein